MRRLWGEMYGGIRNQYAPGGKAAGGGHHGHDNFYESLRCGRRFSAVLPL